MMVSFRSTKTCSQAFLFQVQSMVISVFPHIVLFSWINSALASCNREPGLIHRTAVSVLVASTSREDG